MVALATPCWALGTRTACRRQPAGHRLHVPAASQPNIWVQCKQARPRARCGTPCDTSLVCCTRSPFESPQHDRKERGRRAGYLQRCINMPSLGRVSRCQGALAAVHSSLRARSAPHPAKAWWPASPDVLVPLSARRQCTRRTGEESTNLSQVLWRARQRKPSLDAGRAMQCRTERKHMHSPAGGTGYDWSSRLHRATHCWALARQMPAANGELAAGCRQPPEQPRSKRAHAGPCRACEIARRNPPHGAGDSGGVLCVRQARRNLCRCMQLAGCRAPSGAPLPCSSVVRCCTAPAMVSLWPRGPGRIGPAGTKGAGPQRRGGACLAAHKAY